MSRVIRFKQHGNLKGMVDLFDRMSKKQFVTKLLDKYGKMGVDALKAATPVGTGLTADSWYYEASHGNGYAKIKFMNSNVVYGATGAYNNNYNVALLIQYGHVAGPRKSGTYIQGIDYINPALEPVFEKMCSDLLKDWEAIMEI